MTELRDLGLDEWLTRTPDDDADVWEPGPEDDNEQETEQ